MKKTIKSILAILSIAILFYSCEKSEEVKPVETGSVSLYFDTQAIVGSNSAKLNLDNSGVTDSTTALTNSYTNAAGNKITINQVRYWVSNIVLTDVNGKKFAEPNSYHLIEYTPSSVKEEIEISGIPTGSYSKISFSIGVDEGPNHSLAKKAGDLNETIGMSWTWNTGYIFLKMEGRYEKSAGKYGYYYLHIGTDANYKTLNFDLPENAEVVKTGAPNIHFKNNFLGVFGSSIVGAQNVDLKLGDNSMKGDGLPEKVATNYSLLNAVFSLDHVHQAGE